jgi:hypothetical protein
VDLVLSLVNPTYTFKSYPLEIRFNIVTCLMSLIPLMTPTVTFGVRSGIKDTLSKG